MGRQLQSAMASSSCLWARGGMLRYRGWRTVTAAQGMGRHHNFWGQQQHPGRQGSGEGGRDKGVDTKGTFADGHSLQPVNEILIIRSYSLSHTLNIIPHVISGH